MRLPLRRQTAARRQEVGVSEQTGAPSAPHPSDDTQPEACAPGRVMALDVGTVRIGVALSCPLGRIAMPLCTLLRAQRPFARIDELCREHEVTTLVVGRPLRLSGEVGPAVRAIEGFVHKLESTLDRQVVWVDERMTTAAAQRDMIALGARRQTRRENIDKVAASLILQAYLDRTDLRRPVESFP